MRNKKQITSLLSVSLLLMMSCMLVSCASTTIYVVRHAEKSAPSGDVPLSGEGLQRAEDLKEVLKTEKIQAVYSTNTKRTQQTAAPTASFFGRTTVIYNNGDSLVKALSKLKGKNKLVVGHSNTVPQMLRSLGLKLSFEGNIPDNQYDNLYELTIKRSGEFILQERKYGTASPR